MTIELVCSACGRQHQAGDELAGRACRCSCGATLHVPAKRKSVAATSGTITCVCPNCNRQHQVGPNMFGKQARCGCGGIVSVPAQQPCNAASAPSNDPLGGLDDLGDLSQYIPATAPTPQISGSPQSNPYATPGASQTAVLQNVTPNFQELIKMPLAHCGSCGYQGRVLNAHPGYQWWHLLVGLALMCSGVGVLLLAIIVIVLANQTKASCPACLRSDGLSPWGGEPTDDANRVWEVARRKDEAGFKRQKYIIFGIVMTLLAAAVIFAIVVVSSSGPL